MKEIELSRGYKAQVDDEDYERVNQFKWHVHPGTNNWYAIRYVPGEGKNQLMHRFVLNLTNSSTRVDHSQTLADSTISAAIYELHLLKPTITIAV
jgi:hypothetical protein